MFNSRRGNRGILVGGSIAFRTPARTICIPREFAIGLAIDSAARLTSTMLNRAGPGGRFQQNEH